MVSTYDSIRKSPIVPQAIASMVSGIALFLIIIVTWTLGYQLVYAGRIFPGVSVAGVDVSGLSPSDAAIKLSQNLSYSYTGKILFRDGERVWVATPAELGMVFDPTASAVSAYQLGRSGGLFTSLSGQVRANGVGVDIQPVIIFDQRVAYQYLRQIGTQIDLPVKEAGLSLEGTNVLATPGQVGRELKVDATLIFLGAQLQTFKDGEVSLVVQEIEPQIVDVSSQADLAREILSQPLTVTFPDTGDNSLPPFVYDVQTLAGLLNVRNATSGVQVVLNVDGLSQLLEPVKTRIDRPASNARFIFNDETGLLEPIEQSQTGLVVDVAGSVNAINEALLRGEHTVELMVKVDEPEIPSTITGAELGITQLLWAETSYFYGSSTERIQNIEAAASRFHGVLVAPGETFSMGETMGDVSLENGFAEALIIYGGRTIKGVGGGVCQVSTTLFRTVFNSGFPIVERYSHAYRVSYYEQSASGAVDPRLAGLDATVYFPLVDFKFKNDSPYWILMETYINVGARSLTWKFYSTPDGRTVDWDTTGPVNVVSAPPPLFEENPELKKNQMKQIDWAANGADVTVSRTVLKEGAIWFEDQVTTHYEPWQAVCEYGPDSKDPQKLANEKELCRKPSL